MLGGLGDGLVLGSELGDARPLLLLGLDRLMRGLLRALVLEHSAEDRPGRDLILVAGGVLMFLHVGLVGRHVGDVGESASGHGDVERLLVGPLAVYSVAIPRSAARTSAAAAEGASPITLPGPRSASHARRRPPRARVLPAPPGRLAHRRCDPR